MKFQQFEYLNVMTLIYQQQKPFCIAISSKNWCWKMCGEMQREKMH